jgi:hypothetical protein
LWSWQYPRRERFIQWQPVFGIDEGYEPHSRSDLEQNQWNPHMRVTSKAGVYKLRTSLLSVCVNEWSVRIAPIQAIQPLSLLLHPTLIAENDDQPAQQRESGDSNRDAVHRG